MKSRFLTPGTLVLFIACAAIGALMGVFWPEITALWNLATGGQPVCSGLLAFGLVLAGASTVLVVGHRAAERL